MDKVVKSKIWLAELLLCTLFLFKLSIYSEINHNNSPLPLITYLDEINREISIPQNPSRIISLAPNITEILFAIGAGNKVIGITNYCNFPSEALKVPKIGGFINPDLEKILSLKPDLVIATYDGNSPFDIQKISSFNIPVYCINPVDIPTLLKSIQNLGRITGLEENARNLCEDFQKRLKIVSERVDSSFQNPPMVLVELSEIPLITAGKGTFIDEVIKAAGAINIAGDQPLRYPKFSSEEIVRRNPDFIFIIGMSSFNPTDMNILPLTHSRWDKFPHLSAVARKKIFMINPDLITRPGPRLIEGIELINKVIYGKEK